MNEMKSSDYLKLSIILALLAAAVFYLQRASFFYWFNGYPTLKSAHVIEGSVRVETKQYISKIGRGSQFTVGNYIVDTLGKKHDLTYWFYKNKLLFPLNRFKSEAFNGTRAKVWLHPVWGVLQAEYQKSDTQQKILQTEYPQVFEFEPKPIHTTNTFSVNIGILERKDLLLQNFIHPYEEIKKRNVEYLESHNGISLIFIFFVVCSIVNYSRYAKQSTTEKDQKFTSPQSTNSIHATRSSNSALKKKQLTPLPNLIRIAIRVINFVPLAYFLYHEGPCLANVIKGFLSPDQVKIYECTSLYENPWRFFWVVCVCVVCSFILKLYYHYHFANDNPTEN